MIDAFGKLVDTDKGTQEAMYNGQKCLLPESSELLSVSPNCRLLGKH